jgi:hypothetical protein
VNLPAAEKTQAELNAIAADEHTIDTQAVQDAEKKHRQAQWETENAKIKGLQFEVQAGDICDLRIKNSMFGTSMILKNCRILSIDDDFHRRDYFRVWYEYRVLCRGREQDEDEDFFVYKEKGLY